MQRSCGDGGKRTHLFAKHYNITNYVIHFYPMLHGCYTNTVVFFVVYDDF
jgi:hypothetical protein